ncbi:hypothetical protein AB4072_06620 [Microvirga sp. 2MCAF38]
MKLYIIKAGYQAFAKSFASIDKIVLILFPAMVPSWAISLIPTIPIR